jgi:CRP-like cAMP-binding protein
VSSDFVSTDHHSLDRRPLAQDSEAALAFDGATYRERLAKGTLIQAHGEAASRAIHIDRGVVAVLAMLDDGRCSGCAIAGPGDWLEVIETLDGPTSLQAFCLTDVQITSGRMDDLAGVWSTMPRLGAEIVRSLADQLAQTQQLLLCASHHMIEGRLATLLLRLADRLGDEVHLTQAVLADILGVQRTTVTVAMTAMLRYGAIRPGRARVRIVDRDALQAMTCRCHRAA